MAAWEHRRSSPRPAKLQASPSVGQRRPASASVGQRRPASASVGQRQPASASVGQRLAATRKLLVSRGHPRNRQRWRNARGLSRRVADRQADRQAIAGALRAQARELDAKSIGAWSLRPIDYLSTCQMPAPNVWPGAALRLKESVPAGSDIAILREIRLAWDSLLFRRWLPGRGKV